MWLYIYMTIYMWLYTCDYIQCMYTYSQNIILLYIECEYNYTYNTTNSWRLYSRFPCTIVQLSNVFATSCWQVREHDYFGPNMAKTLWPPNHRKPNSRGRDKMAVEKHRLPLGRYKGLRSLLQNTQNPLTVTYHNVMREKAAFAYLCVCVCAFFQMGTHKHTLKMRPLWVHEECGGHAS